MTLKFPISRINICEVKESPALTNAGEKEKLVIWKATAVLLHNIREVQMSSSFFFFFGSVFRGVTMVTVTPKAGAGTAWERARPRAASPLLPGKVESGI